MNREQNDYAHYKTTLELAHRVARIAAERMPYGPTGTAWVTIRPGTSSFARWLLKTRNATRAKKGGVRITINEHLYSLERNNLHARVLAAILWDEWKHLCIYAESDPEVLLRGDL